MPRKIFKDSDDSEEDQGSDVSDVNEDIAADEDDFLGSESDSAPEDIGFEEGKLTALQKVKETLKQIEKDRLRKKLKRKEHNEIYLEQKRKKMEALAGSRLPDDILDVISSEKLPAAKLKEKDIQTTEALREDTEQDGEDEDSLSDHEANFLHFDNSVKAVCIRDVKPKSSIEQAMAFKKDKLYGKKIGRESTKAKFARKIKKKSQFT